MFDTFHIAPLKVALYNSTPEIYNIFGVVGSTAIFEVKAPYRDTPEEII
jgi:hypothetical protein